MKRLIILAAALCLSGCNKQAAIVSAGGVVGTALEGGSSSIPNQVSDLTAALRAATLVARAADVTVAAIPKTRSNLPKLQQIQKLSRAVRAAVDHEVQQNALGHSVTFGAINAALDAFNAYQGN